MDYPSFWPQFALWRRFKEYTGVWPVCAICAYCLGLVLIVAGVVAIIWLGDVKRGWTRGENGTAIIFGLIPMVLVWLVVERIAWNYDLRQRHLSSEKDVWSINQFPGN